MAKRFGDSFITKTDNYCVSVSELENKNVMLGIDIGCDGFYTELTKKELDKLISMLEKAKKQIIHK